MSFLYRIGIPGNFVPGYARLFAMANMDTAQLPVIVSTLTSARYNYHIGIRTSGDFPTKQSDGRSTSWQLRCQHGTREVSALTVE
jgi:hypothetical protein